MLKWHNIRTYYYINVLVYTLTMLVLTIYNLLLHSGYEAEATRVRTYSKIPSLNFVVTSCLIHSTHHLLMKIPLAILWYVLLFFITIVLAREVFQLGIAPLRYLFSSENYIEIGQN